MAKPLLAKECVVSSFNPSRIDDFDIEDRHSYGTEVFKDAELEVLLHEDSCQTQEEFVGSLGMTQQAISERLKAMAMIQK